MAASPENDRQPIEVVSDEDWKEQVKAADARLDAERASPAQEGPSQERRTPEIDAASVPPASFEIMVQMISTQAIVALGLIPTPDGQVERQLPLARHFIDMLDVLERKCQGNLSPEEGTLLESTLHELRMAYLEVARQGG